ncbi:hypothetical protein VDP40_18715 [Xanthomonas campestris pv. campestris]|nr:hypothetical protein [Xanthomonas campestris pv. campestris]MEB2063750.1 hypothetical protein [Xanthomonas campestris pv. campestris]
MSNYQQIHGFTAAGDERFRTFIAAHFAENPFIAAHYHGDPEEARRDCLSVLEDNLNGVGGPLTWGLLSPSSPGDLPHSFTVDLDELIIADVDNGDEDDADTAASAA